MYIPGPSLVPIVSLEKVNKFFEDLADVGSISGGVGVFGSAAAYALVWEMGARNKQPGPKTVWGTNKDGDLRIFSSQAPEGYVDILSDQFWPIIEDEFSKTNFKSSNSKIFHLELEVFLDNAMQRIARLISDHAPVDSGDLRSQIQYIDSGDYDELSEQISDESYGMVIL